MADFSTFVQKAKTSPFYRWVLNRALHWTVPFNKPHGFRVDMISDTAVRILLPYKRSNFNHIQGLHACALATLTEFSSGLLLITVLGKKYRLILKRLEMDYLYQGKMDAVAEFSISDTWLQEHIYRPLQSNEAIVVTCEVKIVDIQGNHLTTGWVHWQIKDWSRVKTKVG